MRKVLVLMAVLAALTSGCRYSKEYQKLTEAGNKYTTAVDELLVLAGDIQVESSSERMLQDDKIVNQTPVQYQNISRQDREILQTINDIRLHNQLLQKYFNKLEELATSDTPLEAEREITNISNNINSVSFKIRKSRLFSSPSQGVLQNITNLAVHSRIKGAIRKELKKRNHIILQELTLQREMLQEIGAFMKHRIELIKRAREKRFVIRPLVAEKPIENEDEWINERNKIFLIDKQIAELRNASDALNEFKDIFQASVEGKIKSQRLNNSLKNIDSFLALLENTKKSTMQENYYHVNNSGINRINEKIPAKNLFHRNRFCIRTGKRYFQKNCFCQRTSKLCK